MMKTLVLICTSAWFCLASSVLAQPPNIVWIFADDYSAINFGAYGNTLVNTPSIDKLAAEGVVFDNAFVPSPICSPTRSSLITGLYPTSIDVHNHRSHGPSSKVPYQTGYTLPEPVAHLAELFSAGGYYTMVDDKGDYNFNMETIPWDTEDWDTAVKNQPFFAIREIDKTSGAEDDPLKPSEVVVPPFYADEPEIRKVLARTLNGITTGVDPMVADFMADIESAGIGENTIVFFFSDHGKYGFRAKQWLYDTGLKIPLIAWWPGNDSYVKPGTRVSNVVSTVDLAATSLSLAGIPVPEYMDGVVFLGPESEKRDYVAASRDRGDETFDRIRAIRTEDFKYIRNFYPELPYTQYNHYKFNSPELYGNLNVMMEMHEQGTLDPVQDLFFQPVKPPEELYDVRADPWEINNLAQDPAYAGKLDEMRRYLAEWIEYKHPVLGWRDKGAVPESATRTFIVKQENPSSQFVDIVTTVDDPDGADVSLRVEYSLDDGATWSRAALVDRVTADYGQPKVDNRGEYQVTAITTRNAGANTIRLKWDTQSEENGHGAVGRVAIPELRIRTTQFNGSMERESHVSIGGFLRKFPHVVESAEPFSVDLSLLQADSAVRDRFAELNRQSWQEVFFDSGTGDWRKKWSLDGLKAEVSNSAEGMNFRAGPVPDENASHAVLWTRPDFSGDLRIEYDYTRTDEANQYVNILYIQATGSGEEGFPSDISEWADRRTVPAMSVYWGNMHTYHISYAAYGREPVSDDYDYIRARRYRPDLSPKKNGPIFKPDRCERTGLFAPGVPHRITVIKQGNELFMNVRNADREYLCHWVNTDQPPVTGGRIGLRHMYTRSARYRNFRVSILRDQSR